MLGPPKRIERRETFDPPVVSRGASDSAGPPCGESRVSEPGTHEVQGLRYVRFGWQTSVGHIFASRSPRGRKASWFVGALAWRKPAALPDARRGWREGEWVRGCPASAKDAMGSRASGLGSRVRDTTEGASGLLPVLLSTAGRRGTLRPSGQPPPGIAPQGPMVERAAHRADERSDSGVPEGDSRSVRGGHGHGERSSRTDNVRGGSASSA